MQDMLRKACFMLGDPIQGIGHSLLWRPHVQFGSVCFYMGSGSGGIFVCMDLLGYGCMSSPPPGWLSICPVERRRVVQTHSAKGATQTRRAVVCFTVQQSFFHSFLGFHICSTPLCVVQPVYCIMPVLPSTFHMKMVQVAFNSRDWCLHACLQ